MTGRLGWIGASLLFVLATLTACGGGDRGGGSTQAPVLSSVIGPEGGTATGPDGVTVVFPPGAVSQPTTIGIARSSAGAPVPLDAYPGSGAIYEFTPHDVPFNVPVTIRIPAGNLTDARVFTASPGQPWVATTANIANGVAQWDRSSFSWSYVAACFVPPSMENDPYWCAQGAGGSFARVSATPPQAMTQTAFPPNPAGGYFGSYRVDQAANLQFTSSVGVPGNCGNVTVKFLRRQFASNQQWYEVQPQLVSTQSPALTVRSNMLTGTATFNVSFSHLDAGGNQFVMAASYDCPSIVHTSNGSGGFTYSWDTSHLHHTNLFGDAILVSGNVPTPSVLFAVGGTVAGLTGSGLVLQNNGTDFTPVAANGNFTFASSIGGGAPYNVTVLTQPAGQTCTVTNGSGTASAVVTNVAVSCVTTYSIGGTVSGLIGTGLVLQDNGADDLAFTLSGAFSFATQVVAGSPYSVTVLTQPSGSNCTVQNGSGTASAPVTNVVVTCISVGPLALVANSGVSNGTNGLSVYRVNPSTGALGFLNNVNAGNTPYAVAVSPNGLYAYVTNQMGDSVSVYGIDNVNGVLTPLTGRVSNNASGIAMDRLGRYIWVANYGWNTVSAFSIGSNGVLAPVGSPLATTSLPYAISAHPTMDFVYVAHGSSNFAVTVYSVNPSTGALSLQQTLTNVILSPSGIVIDPSGRFAYAVSQSGGISEFRINASTGMLTYIGAVNTGGATFAIAAHPNGQYVYVTNGSSSGNVVVFAINPITGALTQQVGSPYSAGNNPRGVAVNAAGTYLYVTNYVSNDVSAFSISGGGATLTSLGATVPAGSAPQGIAVTP